MAPNAKIAVETANKPELVSLAKVLVVRKQTSSTSEWGSDQKLRCVRESGRSS